MITGKREQLPLQHIIIIIFDLNININVFYQNDNLILDHINFKIS